MPLNLLNKQDRLLRDVYPKSKLLPSLAPEYLPPSQELSRLTYHASNKPSTLHHLASELCSKAEHDAKRAGSSPRYKASIMLTLYILKALCEECRRDLPLFSFSVLKAVSYALDVKLPVTAGTSSAGIDLEILARASSVFRAFAIFTLSPPDTPALAAVYHSILRRFGALSVLVEPRADDETLLRIRLLALAGISAASTSDLLGGREYRVMVEVIVGSLLGCCEGVDIDELLSQAGKEPSTSQPIATHSAPELRLRRAQSVHHEPGLPGPTREEISQAAVSTFRTLMQHANGGQMGEVVEVFCAWLNKGDRWARREWVGGLMEGMAGWGGVQYRFVLPTTLAEVLQSLPDSPSEEVKRATMLYSLTRLLDSPLSLIGLSPSTLLSSLITLLLRHPSPDVIKAIGALASKHYYRDQVVDFIEEVLSRLDGASTPNRLLPLLDASRVILTAGRDVADSGKTSAVAGERNNVPPEIIAQTVHLLGHPNSAVRSACGSLIATYIRHELPMTEESDLRFYRRILSTLHDLLQSASSPSNSSSPHPSSSSNSSPRQRRVSLMVNTVEPEPGDFASASAILVAVVEKGGAAVVPDVVGFLASLHSTAADVFDRVWQAISVRYLSGQPLSGDGKTRAAQLAASSDLQTATGLGQAALVDRLVSPYSPALDADRSPASQTGALRTDRVMGDENASMLSFVHAGVAGGGKQREGLGVGDLREALTGRSSMSTTHLGNRTPSLSSTFNYTSSVRASSIKAGGGRSKTLRAKPDDVAELFRRLGIGKEGRKSRSTSAGVSKTSNGGSVVLKAEDLNLGPIVKTAGQV